VREAIATVPVLIEEAAVTEIGDARAADLPEASERRRVRYLVEQSVQPVTAAFKRRAVVRRAEENELAARCLRQRARA
jgi:hypothetical protein